LIAVEEIIKHSSIFEVHHEEAIGRPGNLSQAPCT
jgi:hypothetical protein